MPRDPVRERVFAEVEAFRVDCVAAVGGLHVLRGARDRDVEVEIEAEDRAGDEHHEYAEGCVFEIGHLDLHGAELDAPADVVVGRWRLEADVLPVRALEVLEVVCFVEVEFLEVFGEDYDGIANEEVREVRGELLIHAAGDELLFDGFVDDEVWVEVFGAEARVLRDVGGVGGVAGFGDAPAVVLKGLKRVSF